MGFRIRPTRGHIADFLAVVELFTLLKKAEFSPPMMKVLERTVSRQGVSNIIFEWARLVFLMTGELDTKLKHGQQALGQLPTEKSLKESL